MEINEAKRYVGADVDVCWLDRTGQEIRQRLYVLEVNFVPLYGPCLITDCGNIRLDRVQQCLKAREAA